MANISSTKWDPPSASAYGVSGLSLKLQKVFARHIQPALASLVETPPARNISLVAVACLVSIWTFSAMFIHFFMGAAETDSVNRARNTAVMASAYIRQTMTSGEIVLRSMKSFLAENGISDATAYRSFVTGKNVHDILRDRVANLQEIDKAAFISEKGEVLNFSFKYPVPAINVADRDYFRQQMEASPPSVTIGMVALDRGSGKWTFYLSQRVLDQAGKPMGLAIVGLKADFLADYFVETTMRDDVAVVLQRDDGVVLTGSGISKDNFGKKFSPLVGLPGERLDGRDQIVETSGPPSIPTTQGGNDYVEAAMGIKGFPVQILVLVNKIAFYKRAMVWSVSLAAAALVISIVILLAWRRSLRLINEGLRMSRISAMQAMISAIAHELNQPLSATANYLAVVAMRLDVTEPEALSHQHDTLQKAQTQLLRAGEIIKRLRGFISDGKTDLQEVALAEVIEGAIDFSLVRDRHKDITVDVHLDSGPCHVYVDPIQVQQVLLNLIRNSAEAMNGQKDKRIDIVARAIGNGMVEVRVSDTGPGLPPKIARHAFEPFNTTKADGMGVGLAICRTIIESHGGTIRYFPGPNGANFAFTVREQRH